MTPLPWVPDDGGRAAAGFKGSTGDCVTRALAIATGEPYRQVYDELHRSVLDDRRRMAKLELRYGRHARRHASPREGVSKEVQREFLMDRHWRWQPTMGIGTGCQVHVAEGELPAHPLMILSLSRHVATVVDGVVHDNYDPSRGGTRCVYGVWFPPDRPYPIFTNGAWHEPACGYPLWTPEHLHLGTELVQSVYERDRDKGLPRRDGDRRSPPQREEPPPRLRGRG
jgi:hypothetical protein